MLVETGYFWRGGNFATDYIPLTCLETPTPRSSSIQHTLFNPFFQDISTSMFSLRTLVLSLAIASTGVFAQRNPSSDTFNQSNQSHYSSHCRRYRQRKHKSP